MGYSSEIKEDKTTEEPDDNTNNGEWTDFSKSKFDLKKNGISSAIIEVSGVTPKEESFYDLLITPNNSKPNVTGDISTKRITLSYDNNTKTFKTTDTAEVAKYVELNQDIYVSIVERRNSIDNIVTYGNKLERYAEAKYSDAFHATFYIDNNKYVYVDETYKRWRTTTYDLWNYAIRWRKWII